MRERPYLSAKLVRAALNALRLGAPLGDHVLADFLVVQRRLLTPEAVHGPAATDQAVYQLLVESITGRLDHQRALEALPLTTEVGAGRAAIEEGLCGDFRRGNAELEAWSALYHRYVRVDLDLQMRALAALASQDLRTIRRRLAHGVARLTACLIGAERAARAQQARLRMRLALPVAVPPALIGVEEVAEQAWEALVAESGAVVLHGAGGLGKTALAHWLAHRLIDQDRIDDLVWLTGAPPEALVARLLEGLGQSEAHTDPATRLLALRAHAQTYRLLIVLDAAEALIEEPAALRELLDALGKARLLITSRVAPPVASGAQVVTLPELDERAAWELMEREAQLHAAPDAPGRADQFARVWETVGGNPLALRVAVGHLRFFSAGRVAARLAALPVGEGSLFDALYRAAWETLDGDARRVWLALLLFPAAGAPDLEAALDMPPEALDRAIVTVVRRSLVEVGPDEGDPQYSLHRLPRAFLESLLAEDAPLDDLATARAMIGECARVVVAGLVSGDLSAGVVFERGAHLLEIASRFGMDTPTALSLVPPVHACAASLGRWAAWAPLLRGALGLVPEPGDRAALLVRLGEAERNLGRCDEAATLLLEAIRLASEAEKPAIRAAALIELAAVYRLSGRPGAEGTARRALQGFEALGDEAGVSRALIELAQVCLDAGRPEQTLSLLGRAPAAESARWQALAGNAYLVQGRLEEALRAHQRALELARMGEHRLNVARALVNLGRTQLAAGDLHPAETSFEQALAIMDQTRDVLGRVRARANLAVLYAQRGHHRRAIELLEAVLAEQDAFGDWQGATVSRRNLADLRLTAAETALNRGQVRAAMRHLSDGQALYAQLGMDEQARQANHMLQELRATRGAKE